MLRSAEELKYLTLLSLRKSICARHILQTHSAMCLKTEYGGKDSRLPSASFSREAVAIAFLLSRKHGNGVSAYRYIVAHPRAIRGGKKKKKNKLRMRARERYRSTNDHFTREYASSLARVLFSPPPPPSLPPSCKLIPTVQTRVRISHVYFFSLFLGFFFSRISQPDSNDIRPRIVDTEVVCRSLYG